MAKSQLKVEIGRPSLGWIFIEITCGDFELGDPMISSILGDPCLPLCWAVGAAMDDLDGIASLYTEDNYWHLLFLQTDKAGVVELRIQDRPRAKRSKFPPPECIFSLKDDKRRIVMPFWRALRKLQSEVTPEEYSEGMGYPFPEKELNELMYRLKGQR